MTRYSIDSKKYQTSTIEAKHHKCWIWTHQTLVSQSEKNTCWTLSTDDVFSVLSGPRIRGQKHGIMSSLKTTMPSLALLWPLLSHNSQGDSEPSKFQQGVLFRANKHSSSWCDPFKKLTCACPFRTESKHHTVETWIQDAALLFPIQRTSHDKWPPCCLDLQTPKTSVQLGGGTGNVLKMVRLEKPWKMSVLNIMNKHLITLELAHLSDHHQIL